MKIIGHIRTDFPEKFGLPRQSGLVPGLRGRIVFLPEYRVPAALRGIEGFSHLWLIWEFSDAVRSTWSPTVRPPRLGGNTRMGVFATRSPFRPNPIGLSCVGLDAVNYDAPDGPVLLVSGIDMRDNTPLYDIKPYLPHADCRPEATGGFATAAALHTLTVELPPELAAPFSPADAEALRALLAEDPRPGYSDDPERVYGFCFAGKEIRFTVDGDQLVVRTVSPKRG